jgi:hypothetical protein
MMHTLQQTAAVLPAILRGLRLEGLTVIGPAKLVSIGTPSAGGWPRYSDL